MHIGIFGAGAVGCYYGAMLAQAGHDVTLVGRESLVRSISTSGLCLEMKGETIHPRVDASLEPADLAGCELLVVSVKSIDTEPAARAISPHVRGVADILSFQNGVENAGRLSGLLGREVIPVSVYVAAELIAPGHVRHNGRGDIVLGASTRSGQLAKMFVEARIAATVSDDIRRSLWLKLVLNCAYNALSAITQLPYGTLMAGDGVTAVMRDIIRECDAVGSAEGISLTQDDVESILGLASSMPNQSSSMAQDLARGRQTEIDDINGYIVRKGREYGVPTPINRTLLTLVKLLLERKDTPRG